MAADTKDDASKPDYLDKLEAFRKSDADRDALVSRIIQEYEDLKKKVEEVTDDYKNEVASRRMWQSKATSCERDLEQALVSASSSNFTLVLVDGDGAVFADYLYAMGKEGGAEAAHQLNGEVQKHLKLMHPSANVDDWAIVVQVVLNLSGLANKLQQCGIIVHSNELLEFGRQFGLAHPLFSFVDVGLGKERADHKIRETMRLYMKNAQCKVLENYRRDHADRLTLIETRPAERGFIALGLKRISMPRVFRSDDLPNSSPSKIRSTMPPPATPPTRSRAPSSVQANSASFTPSVPKTPSPVPSISSTNSTANSSSWATIGKNGTPKKSISIAPTPKPLRKHILVNAYNDRLDPELPRKDPAAEARFAERIKTKGKCCNNFYLAGYCAAGSYCDYDHSAKLSSGELLVLKYKARMIFCAKGNLCRDFACPYGHACRLGQRCARNPCYGTHDVDLEVAKRIFEDGTEEWVPEYLEKTALKGRAAGR